MGRDQAVWSPGARLPGSPLAVIQVPENLAAPRGLSLRPQQPEISSELRDFPHLDRNSQSWKFQGPEGELIKFRFLSWGRGIFSGALFYVGSPEPQQSKG